jgi:hypothetical protein
MMKSFKETFSPSITDMIRIDHTQVMETFRQYDPAASANTKKAVVGSACLALEIHMQLEEEIFYPALRTAGADDEMLAKSTPEHNEVRRLIGQLRSLDAMDPSYDQTFLLMMRNVMHHVADEETTLLPDAERLLADQIGELGAEMTKRRLQLTAPRAGEIAVNTLRGFPASSMLVAAGAVLAGTYFAKRAMHGVGHRRH